MPSLKNTVRALGRLLGWTAREPKLTTDLLKRVPAVANGVQFGRQTDFSAPRRQQGEAPKAVNPLLDYFESHREGPGIWKWRHYFDIYHRHFAKFVGRQVNIMEVGV